ncbi:phage tail sheath C-terminal domain-containing protein [Roseateles sp. PN1]|uniref:phage tail sheath C-terminal domain-containing protein n=1 Tax=Roseateles sp. PN1 TaxID=3137372 RepID=UPI003138D6A5
MTHNPPSLRRLPGVRFDVPAPTLDLTLPRMDIALFVGFAGSGPLTAAVAVESLAEFETVFGGPLPLALDMATGACLTGHLHAAVRAFFSQGGRRCWVQRVAGAGLTTSRLPLPSLLRVRRRAAGHPWQLRPASLPARSPGSGADRVQVAARVLPTPLRARALDKSTLELAAPGAALRPGDLLRIALGPIRMHLRVDSMNGLRLRIDGRVAIKPLLGDPFSNLPVPEGTEGADATPAVRHQWQADGRLSLWLRALPQDLPQRGQVLALGFPQRRAWMSIAEPEISAAPDLDGRVEIVVTGRPWRLSLNSARRAFEAWCADPQPRLLQLLRLDLRTRSSPGQQTVLADLSLANPPDSADPAARGVFGLPNDEQLFGSGDGGAATSAFAERDALGRLSGRFELASNPMSGTGMLVPLEDLDDFDAQLHALPSPFSALQRDGLHEYGWQLFAEPLLAGYGADLLADKAEALRLTGADPRRPASLRGMHAVFGARPEHFADEPTLLVLPDAIHPGWRPITAAPTAWTELSPLPEPPAPGVGEPFRACDSAPLPRPAFVRGPDPRTDGAFTLFWSHAIAGARYELQQAIEASFDGAITIQQGPATRFDAGPHKPGTAFYRVRAELGPRRSPWSAPVRIVIGLQGWEALPWQDKNLTAIHRLMLRTAAGRGDILALLSLPMAYDTEQACRHADRLRATRAAGTPNSPNSPDSHEPPAIGENESRALSHGALLHPWLMIRRDTEDIWFPPDGPVCGQLATTALERGAWIAAANRPLRDVVSLSRPGLRPTLGQRQQLLDAQVNLLRSAPLGFIVSSSDTLSPAADWRPISVRRLMCLLRRLALQRGVTYVFEPNGATLRRTVERGFEAMLDQLYRRGALAGASAAQAFQVNVGDDINTRQRRDAGQFWVELKVAPALPMSFLTVLLMRSGERVQSQEVH